MMRPFQEVLTAAGCDLADIPAVLWWVAGARPQALWVIEERGRAAARAAAELEVALERLGEALAEARRRWEVAGSPPEEPGPWHWWTLFTPPGERGSALAAWLREGVVKG